MEPQTHHSTRQVQVSRETGLTQSSVFRIICCDECDLGLNFLKCPKSRRAHEFTAAMVSFTYIDVSQGSVATQFICGGIVDNHLNSLYCQFSTECGSEIIFKIGQYLAKIWTK